MNLWHDLRRDRVKIDDFVAVIEIKKGTKNKYELDKETGRLILDRILYTAMRYPANYGFIPLTLGEDNDPLDVLVIASEEIDAMTLVRCYPIGVIRMTDNDEHDDKIVAIPYSDPTYHHIRDLKELSPHLLDELMHFFRVYKQLENKQTEDISVLGLEDAKVIFEQALERYKQFFQKNKKK